MTAQSRTPSNTRPATPSGLGLGSSNIKPTKRSISSSSTSSLKGVAPCFHTTRPQFISGHIDRCEACRLKYARQAEQLTIPYTQLALRRSSGIQQRPQSQQSQQSPRSGKRPNSSMGATTGHSSTAAGNASQRPSSRASVASAASRLQDTGRETRTTHHRSSSAGTLLADSRANTKRAIARAAEEAFCGDSAHAGAFPAPPKRGEVPVMPLGLDNGIAMSPTEATAARARSKAVRNGRKSTVEAPPLAQQAGYESPISYVKAAQRPATARMGHSDNSSGERPMDFRDALMDSLVDRSRDYDKMKDEYEARITRLQSEMRRMRRESTLSQNEREGGQSEILFDPNTASARQKVIERGVELDKAALDKFDEFRRAYEDCEPSLRSSRAQFAGERPLSPPAGRGWGATGNGQVATMRAGREGVELLDARVAALGAAEVRRAGTELMSTPVLRRTQRVQRVASTQQPPRVGRARVGRSLFQNGSGELSDSAGGTSDGDSESEDEHSNVRNCLVSASRFGTFLVQYVTRQSLDHSLISEENVRLQLRADELEKRAGQLERQTRRLEETRDEQIAQAYDMSVQREQLCEKLDAAERNARRVANENDRLRHELAAAGERTQGLDEQISRGGAALTKARQRYEHEIAGLRRSTNVLQQEKQQAVRHNDELRAELKGKLQRAGLKSNVDEYLAGRRMGTAGSSVDAPRETKNNGAAGSETEGAAADGEIRRLQETVQFWRKKTDRVNRKLRTERHANREASRMLRLQQEETARYQQAFGPLGEDEGGTGALESLGDYLPTQLGGSRRDSMLTEASAGRADGNGGSGDDSEALLTDASNTSKRLSAALDGGDDAAVRRVGSQSSLSSIGSAGDAQDIRRYEQRMRSRRAFATPRQSGRASAARAATTGGARRTAGRALTVDVGGGESLGEILGASSQWGDAASTRSRTRSFRGGSSPFGESPNAFAIGFDASVSLAEQFAAAARPNAAPNHPQTADVSTATDTSDAPRATSLAVQTDLSAGTTTACSATDPLVGTATAAVFAAPSAASLAVQTSTATATACNITDPLIGTATVAILAAPATVSTGMDARAALEDVAAATDYSEGVADTFVDAVPAACEAVVAAVPTLADASASTLDAAVVDRGADAPLVETVDAGVSVLPMALGDAQTSTDDNSLGVWLAPLLPPGISGAAVLAALQREGQPVYELYAAQQADAAADEHARLSAQAEEARELASISRGTSALADLVDYGVQVQPSTLDTAQHAGWAATTDAAVDAPVTPARANAVVATGGGAVDRSVDAFDAVARADCAVCAVPPTANGFTVPSAVCASDIATMSVIDTLESATSTAVGTCDAAVGSAVAELCEKSIQAGVSETAVATTSTAMTVVDAVVDTVCGTADRAVGAATCDTADQTTSAFVCDTAKRETGADTSATDFSVSTGAAGIIARATSLAVLADAETQASAAVAEATTAAESSATRGVAAHSVFSDSTYAGVQLADVAVVSETTASAMSGSAFEVVDAPSEQTASLVPSLPSASTPLDRPYSASLRLDSSLHSRPPAPGALVPPAKAKSIHSLSPTIPLPPLPPHSSSLPGFARYTSDTFAPPAVPILRSGASPLQIVASPTREESDGEDYGYIMVSPRTHVQRVPVAALSASGASSLSRAGCKEEYRALTATGVLPGEDIPARAATEISRAHAHDSEPEDAGDVADVVAADGRAVSVASVVAMDSEVPAEGHSLAAVAVDTRDLATLHSEDPAFGHSEDLNVGRPPQPSPLIVQAIARTMVGAFMWKYTPTRFANNTARERRHQRYFWIHPYAKLLNWSKQQPSSGMGISRSTRESGGRSVYMRDVRIVEEPRASTAVSGEPAYFIVIRTDHREIKIKAASQADHDLWCMALTYLQTRRIITSATYPAALHATEYSHSDDSLCSRDSSMPAAASRRAVMRADRRTRIGLSTERSRSRPRAPISVVHAPPPHPQSSVASLTSNSNFAVHSSRATSPLPHLHRSTLDITPTRQHSVPAAASLPRPVSMLPAVAATPTPTHESSKRLSISLFRKSANSTSSLFRHASHASEDSAAAQVSSPPMPHFLHSDDAVVATTPPQSIAAAMMGSAPASHLESSSSSRGSVRKMFSGSFLRSLRSRESVVEEDNAH
ncbi:hypothetical protein COEREDRAFT_10874 [Coemansia reversa NRRL 1564]|uniref:PH domain-containing protein n=1 Tax=Coemansia reversa (strain ATCC 12441 / NRRL 1564) TaxID=763665 RepID=A0A2G5B4K6_COERN|nr:hypothetical protein COEREDRAFT_10874 [Coemansia reversa NRRL 1564]|eukprot:PIA13935.1 hypothetical protein COEREDRAFT_10874 [Coemansia reversa NRRL 1564]